MVYQKAFPTAKFGKKAQRSQRANGPFITPHLPYTPILFFAVILSDELLIQIQDLIFRLTE